MALIVACVQSSEILQLAFLKTPASEWIHMAQCGAATVAFRRGSIQLAVVIVLETTCRLSPSRCSRKGVVGSLSRDSPAFPKNPLSDLFVL